MNKQQALCQVQPQVSRTRHNINTMSNGKMSGNNWSLIEKLFRVRTFTLPQLIHCQRFTKLIVKFFFCLDLGTYASNINSRSTSSLKNPFPFLPRFHGFTPRYFKSNLVYWSGPGPQIVTYVIPCNTNAHLRLTFLSFIFFIIH